MMSLFPNKSHLLYPVHRGWLGGGFTGGGSAYKLDIERVVVFKGAKTPIAVNMLDIGLQKGRCGGMM